MRLVIILTILFYSCANNNDVHDKKAKPLNIVFDTIGRVVDTQIWPSKYYAATNFAQIDSLDLWCYDLDTLTKGYEGDSIKSIGELTFWRTRPLNNNLTPHITFSIYNISDSIFCFNASTNTRLISSCIPPQVGGDIIFMGKFILLSYGVCLNCQEHLHQKDLCRPTINFVLSKVDRKKIKSFQNIKDQLILKRKRFDLYDKASS